LDKDKKLGSLGVSYGYFFDESDLSISLKLYEEDQKLQNEESVLYPLPLSYNAALKSETSKKRPTVYIKYTTVIDNTDLGLIIQNGYNDRRNYILLDAQFIQYAYLVNKFLMYSTTILDDTIYKFEYAKTDVDKYTLIKDYYELGFGVEHTIYSLFDNADLGVLGEYYRSDHNQENEFDNDLFIGARVTMNDTRNSEILSGFLKDLDRQKTNFLFEYSTRLMDHYKFNVKLLHTDAFDAVSLDAGYYF
jgi:hypothetical protein